MVFMCVFGEALRDGAIGFRSLMKEIGTDERLYRGMQVHIFMQPLPVSPKF